jgi:hypothetical protein
MINTGMWIQGTILQGVANQLEQMLRNKMVRAQLLVLGIALAIGEGHHPSFTGITRSSILLTTEIVRAMSRRNPSAVASTM